jgi:hypothetical protein
MAYGIFLITADISPRLRQTMITSISSTTMCYNMIFATSALAEGVNMISLRHIIIAGVKYEKRVYHISVKVQQMLGRLNREDRSGIAYVPDPAILNTTSNFKHIAIIAAYTFLALISNETFNNIKTMLDVSENPRDLILDNETRKLTMLNLEFQIENAPLKSIGIFCTYVQLISCNVPYPVIMLCDTGWRYTLFGRILKLFGTDKGISGKGLFAYYASLGAVLRMLIFIFIGAMIISFKLLFRTNIAGSSDILNDRYVKFHTSRT